MPWVDNRQCFPMNTVLGRYSVDISSQSCATLELFLFFKGENIETELSSLATELKSDFERTATLALNLKDCVAFYDDFVSCVISSR